MPMTDRGATSRSGPTAGAGGSSDASRAVSTAMSYALVLGIVTLLLTGVIAGFAPLVENQRAEATHSTLEVLGNDLAGDVGNADHLASATGGDGTVVLRTRLPDRVGGSPYEIEVTEVDPDSDANRYEILVTSPDRETSAAVGLRTTTPVDAAATDTLDGGPVEIVYDGTALVVREDD